MTEAARHPVSLGDVLAGVTVAMILIPQALAYADIAGLPPINGLYAAAVAPFVAAFFASSPYLQTGPVAMTSSGAPRSAVVCHGSSPLAAHHSPLTRTDGLRVVLANIVPRLTSTTTTSS